MATTKLVLTNVPVQITDGSTKAFIQSMHDKNFRWCDSATAPDKTAYHFSTQREVEIGSKIWIWNPSDDDANVMSVTYTIFGT